MVGSIVSNSAMDYWLVGRNCYRISPMDLLVEIFALPNSIVAECFRRIGISSEQLMEIAILAEQQIEFE